MAKWINIFKTGTHTDSSGRRRTWTDSDLEKIVSNFEQRTEDPPIVFGHPKDSDPAQGWFERVRKNGEFLQAQFAQISDKARKGLDNEDYKYGSLSLTPELKIRHFGLLGAVPPAVKGLGKVEFQEDEGMTVFFNFNESVLDEPKPEDSMTEVELKAQLKAKEEEVAKEKTAREKAEAALKTKEDEAVKLAADQRTADHAAKVDKLIEDGKLLPAHKDKVLAFCEALDGENGSEEICFSADEGKKPLTEHFLNFMADGKGHGLLHEFSAPPAQGEAVTEDLTQYV